MKTNLLLARGEELPGCELLQSTLCQRAFIGRALLLLALFWAGRALTIAHDEGSGPHLGPENTNSPAATPMANVRFVGRIDPFPGNNMYSEVYGEGDYAYLGSYEHEDVAIIDISNPTDPKLAGVYHGTTNGFIGDIHVKNGIAYLASDGPNTNKPSGVYIVDVSDPAQPVLRSQITAAQKGYNKVHTLFLDGNYLYLADSRTPVVKVFDVSVSSDPAFVRDIRTADSLFIHDTTVLNNRLYTSGWGGRTEIYDVTDIATRAPVRLGTINSGPTSHSTWVNHNGTILASCAEFEAKDLRIYNISDLVAPRLLKRFTSQTLGVDATTPHNPVIVDDLLFVSWYQAGLQIVNIRDPANPLLVGAFDTFVGGTNVPGASVTGNDGCWGVYPLLGLDRVLLSDRDGGLLIVDASRLGGLDADGDRLPDAWEKQHGLSDANTGDALIDSDGDGTSNLHEFLSGTDPATPDTAARLTRVERSGRDTAVSFAAQNGRLYCLERNTRPANTGWTLVRDEVQTTNGTATVTHTNSTAALQFYRVRIVP